MPGLTAAQRAHFDAHGFLPLPQLFPYHVLQVRRYNAARTQPAGTCPIIPPSRFLAYKALGFDVDQSQQ